MSDSRRIDGIDLPSLVSFGIDSDSFHFGSFRFAKLRMHSITILLFSGIDLPSLKSIHVGDGCFYSTSRVEMISEVVLSHLAHRSSSIGIITHWFICLSGRHQPF